MYVFICIIKHFSLCPVCVPAFYSSKYGYKMCLRLYLNGDGSGRSTHLSLFFVVMRGKYDALVKWPFSQKVRHVLHIHLLPDRSRLSVMFTSAPPSSLSFTLPDSRTFLEQLRRRGLFHGHEWLTTCPARFGKIILNYNLTAF